MRNVWWRRAVQQRLGTLVVAALVVWILGTAAAASIATERIARSITTERELRAGDIASRVELAVEDDLRQLDLIAAASLPPADAAALAAHCRGVRLGESVLRVAADGRVLWMRAVTDGGERPPIVGTVGPPADGRWHVRPTDVLDAGELSYSYLVLPARESDPSGGAVVAVVPTQSRALRALVESPAGGPYRVELVDAKGREIVANSSPSGRAAGSTAITGRAADAPPAGADLLVAVAPVGGGPWQIRLAQPRAEALAPVLALRRTLLWSSLLALAFAVLAAWGTARSIREPVLAMTADAERLARGDLGHPVMAAGEDEIARLARALEQLRLALQGDERRSLVLKRVITAQEEERRRIARELHDQTTQQLTALVLQLDTAAAAIPASTEVLVQARAIARAAIDDVHRVIHDLRPSILDDLGLLPAIRWYAETRLAQHGVKVVDEFPESLPPLTVEASTALYRVAQEALTNITRHANADTVLIACTLADGRITLEIEDDGQGFDPDSVKRPRESGEGLGLLGMRERLALLGGHLEIESERGAGTRVIAVLSLAPAAGEAHA